MKKRIIALLLSAVMMLCAIPAFAVSPEEHNVMLSKYGINPAEPRAAKGGNGVILVTATQPDELKKAKEDAYKQIEEAAGDPSTRTEEMKFEVEYAKSAVDWCETVEEIEEMLRLAMEFIEAQHLRESAIKEIKGLIGDDPTEEEAFIFEYFCEEISYAYQDTIDTVITDCKNLLKNPSLGVQKVCAIYEFEEKYYDKFDYSYELMDIGEKTRRAILDSEDEYEIEQALATGFEEMKEHFAKPACEDSIGLFCKIYNSLRKSPVLGPLVAKLHSYSHYFVNRINGFFNHLFVTL